MLNNLWNGIKLWFVTLSQSNWLENHFLYFSILGGVAVFVFLILIIIRINKDIKRIDCNLQNKAVDYMRKTSKHNKPGRKRLKF